MALRVCLGCGTAYAVGIQACPQCGTPTRNAIYDWEDDVVAHANPQGASLYVDEGQPIPGDVPEGVRLVGPGAPADAPQEPEPEVAPAPPPVSAPKADWVEHAAAAGVLPLDEAESLTKAELVETVKQAAPEPLPPAGASTPSPSSPASSAPADGEERAP